MAVLVTIPSRAYAPQTSTRRVTLPLGVEAVRISLSREAWPNGHVGTMRIRFSTGAEARANFPGGDVLNRSGTVALVSSLTVDRPSDSTRVVDVFIDLVQPISTEVTVEAF